MQLFRNGWPTSIIASFVLFIGAMAGLITMACSQKMDLVSPDYYAREIAFQKDLESMQRAESLNGRAGVTCDLPRRQIVISLPREHALGSVSGRIELYRPSAAGLDRQCALKLDPQGVQRLDSSQLNPGLWKVRVRWYSGNQEYLLDRSVLLGDSAALQNYHR